jgi:hypothetical protein
MTCYPPGPHQNEIEQGPGGLGRRVIRERIAAVSDASIVIARRFRGPHDAVSASATRAGPGDERIVYPIPGGRPLARPPVAASRQAERSS